MEWKEWEPLSNESQSHPGETHQKVWVHRHAMECMHGAIMIKLAKLFVYLSVCIFVSLSAPYIVCNVYIMSCLSVCLPVCLSVMSIWQLRDGGQHGA